MLFSPAVQADDEEEVVAIDEYMPIGKEPFKINLSGRGDHLMVLEAQAYIRSERAKSALKLHLPKIRNDLLKLLEKQRYRSMKKGRVKRKLRSRMLKVIRKVFQLRDLPGGEEVEEIVITKILLQ